MPSNTVTPPPKPADFQALKACSTKAAMYKTTNEGQGRQEPRRVAAVGRTWRIQQTSAAADGAAVVHDAFAFNSQSYQATGNT
jgi:hypothetical protein